MPTPVLVYGAGGHAKVVADILERCPQYTVLGFLDDRRDLWNSDFLGYTVLGGMRVLNRNKASGAHLLLAIGVAAVRRQLAHDLKRAGWSFAIAIHPSAQIGRDVVIGEGTVVMANAVINTGTRLGGHVIINTAATVDHDCTIEDFAHMSPGAHLGGGVHVREGAQVGIGASVIPGISIGRWSMVGAGATVIRNIPDNVIAVGTPARPLQAAVTKRASEAP